MSNTFHDVIVPASEERRRKPNLLSSWILFLVTFSEMWLDFQPCAEFELFGEPQVDLHYLPNIIYI